MKRVVVLGGGVTGLAAAYRLSQDRSTQVHVVEREPEVGGLCRSFRDGDFILDHGPHKFYSLVPGVVDNLVKLMGDDLLVRDKSQSLYMNGNYFTFPFKMSEMILKFPPWKSAAFISSFALQTLRNFLPHKEAETYEEFIVERFGAKLYGQIFEPMARKIYGDPKQLDRKLAEVRISSPGMISVIKQIIFRSKIDGTISAPNFHYPKFGYGMIPQRLKEAAEKNGAIFHTGSSAVSMETKEDHVSTVVIRGPKGQERLDCDHVVYTIPLSLLSDLMPNDLPTDVRSAARFVSYRNTIIYYFLLRSKPVLPSMWVFFPESRFRFGRLSEMSKFSPYTSPEGQTALMVDFTCEPTEAVWHMNDDELGNLLLEQLQPLNLFAPNQVIRRFSKRAANFYPVYSTGYQKQLNKLRSLEERFQNLLFIGRLGDFNYNNADQCLDMGFLAADQIQKHGTANRDWNEVRTKRFEQYKIVD